MKVALFSAAIAFTFVASTVAQEPALKQRPEQTAVQISPATLPMGTDLHLTLDEEISSANVKIGEGFGARLSEPVTVNGSVLLPQGTVVRGRVKDVTNSGRRFNGKNSVTLRPETIILPNGKQIDISAMMIDSFDRRAFRIDDEGAISNSATHYTTFSLIGAGAGTVAGLMVAGPKGAIVGAGLGAALPAARWATKDDPVVLPSGSAYWFEITRPAKLPTAEVKTITPGAN